MITSLQQLHLCVRPPFVDLLSCIEFDIEKMDLTPMPCDLVKIPQLK